MTIINSLSEDIFLNDSTPNVSLKSLDEMLDSIGLAPWMSKVTTVSLPIINILGVVGCSLSAWVFFRKEFVDSIFFYHRLLCLVNIVSLVHNIPACILFSPRYFPSANTWAIAMFKAYYAFATIFLFHYCEILQMGILLARMKIYSPFVKKHFKASPPFVSLVFFLLCLIIDFPLAFAFKVIYYGDYYYYLNSDINQKSIATFFYYGASDFSETKFGKILLGIFGLALNMFGSLVAGVTLNIVSYLKYKQYILDRERKDEEIQMRSIAIVQCSSLGCNEDPQRQLKKLTQKELNELKAEKNMFHMIITLCLISIVSRVIIISGNLYALFFFSVTTVWALVAVCYFMYALVPAVSIIIFYAFNKLFRKEFKVMLGLNKKKIAATPNSSSN